MTAIGDNLEMENAAQLNKASKEEIAAKPLNSRREKIAFLSAVLFTAGSLIIHDKRLCAAVTTRHESIKDAVATVVRSLTGKEPVAENTGKTCEIVIDGAQELLCECGVLNKETLVACERIDQSVVADRVSAAAYVRGAYLGSGSLNAAKYHLEFSFGKASVAKDFAALLDGFGIKTEFTVHKQRAMVYTKDSEHISDCLALMGGVKAVLALNSIMAARQMSAHINRQQNCDMYNIDRQINTGIEQCAYLKELDLSELSASLREAAQARLSHPDYSYEQLAAMLGLTKSGLKNRLRRLKEIYNSAKSDE